jgi:hypothetical protein
MVKVANLRLRVTGGFLKKQSLMLSLFSTNHRIVMTDTAELAEIPTLLSAGRVIAAIGLLAKVRGLSTPSRVSLPSVFLLLGSCQTSILEKNLTNGLHETDFKWVISPASQLSRLSCPTQATQES